MKKTILTLIILGLGFEGSLIAKPAWCKNAHTYVEKRICKSQKLMNLDEEENTLYKRIKKYIKDNYQEKIYKRFLKDEEVWIMDRDANCYQKGDSCIAQKYKERIKELYSIISGQ